MLSSDKYGCWPVSIGCWARDCCRFAYALCKHSVPKFEGNDNNNSTFEIISNRRFFTSKHHNGLSYAYANIPQLRWFFFHSRFSTLDSIMTKSLSLLSRMNYAMEIVITLRFWVIFIAKKCRLFFCTPPQWSQQSPHQRKHTKKNILNWIDKWLAKRMIHKNNDISPSFGRANENFGLAFSKVYNFSSKYLNEIVSYTMGWVHPMRLAGTMSADVIRFAHRSLFSSQWILMDEQIFVILQ